MSDLLIDALSLQQVLSDPKWIVFDVRYSLSDPAAGQQQFQEGHIPGAYFLDQGTQLAGQCTGTNGRHPLPEADDFMRLMAYAGARPDSDIVVYDQNDGSFAARAWWLLRWQGYKHVRLLDGGFQAWVEAGGKLQASQNGLTQATDGQCPQAESAASTTMPVVTAAEILSWEADGSRFILDARTPERYRGEIEPIDPVAGRIPGALNRPIAQNVRHDGRFKSAAQLHAEFTTLLGSRSAQQVIHYCGSGITACHNVFAMELAGLAGSALYPGSWSEWCSDHDRPLARG